MRSISSARENANEISEFFRNMPDHDGKLCGTSVKEISFDASPAEFALLLDLIDNRHITTSPDWQDLGNVLQLGETFHFIHLYLLVARQARQSPPKGNPWAAFVLSANNGYAEVAQRALADFSKTHLWASTSEEVTPDQLADLTGRAATALICAMRRAVVSPRKVYYPETKENVYKSMTDWQGVVKDFEYGW